MKYLIFRVHRALKALSGAEELQQLNSPLNWRSMIDMFYTPGARRGGDLQEMDVVWEVEVEVRGHLKGSESAEHGEVLCRCPQLLQCEASDTW
jgi:hypothetical protein